MGWKYDDTGREFSQWEQKCGQTFWNGPLTEWHELANNMEDCKGSMCQSRTEDVAGICSADCLNGGCTIKLDSYAAMLIHMSTLRAESVFNGSATMHSTVLARVQELAAVKRVLSHFQTFVRGNAAKELIDAQIGALDTMTQSAARMTATGLVPAFTRRFYTERLAQYTDNFRDLRSELRDESNKLIMNQELQKLTGGFLRILNTYTDVKADKLNGQQGVISVMRDGAQRALRSALDGVNAAVRGLEQTESLVSEAAEEFDAALKQYRKAQRRAAFMSIAKALVNPVKRWPKRPSEFGRDMSFAGVNNDIVNRAQGIGYKMSVVVNMTVNVYHLQKGLRDLSYAFDSDIKLEASKGASMLARDLDMLDLEKAITVEELLSATSDLNNLLPELGEGFWRQYVTNTSYVYNEFLTGYSNQINGAARNYLNRLEDQAAFGNDYTAQGYRLVEAIQQLAIYDAMDEANRNSTAALVAAQEEISRQAATNEYHTAGHEVLMIQMSSLAVQIETTIQQLCSSYAYQNTGLFADCMDRPEGKDLQALCSASVEGRLDFKPLALPPCSADGQTEKSAMEMHDAAMEYMDRLNGRHELAKRVNEWIVVNGVGAAVGPDAYYRNVFEQIEIEVWEPAPCECGSRFDRNCKEVTTFMTCNPGELDPDDKDVVDKAMCADVPHFNETENFCCKFTEMKKLCDDQLPPTDKPYIHKEAWDRFKDTSKPRTAGVLTFSLTPEHFKDRLGLGNMDEIFIRTATVYVDGANIDHEGRNAALSARLTPVGEMTTRVEEASLRNDATCKQWRRDDPSNLCIYRNHSFVGAPSGHGATAMADFITTYHNPKRVTRPRRWICHDNADASSIFLNAPQRHIEGGRDKFWCPVNMNLQVIDDYAPAAIFLQPGMPFNSPSLFSSFRLSVFNHQNENSETGARFDGIDLTSSKKVHIGMWLRTVTRPSGDALNARCDRIG